jgi:hypothetical protein
MDDGDDQGLSSDVKRDSGDGRDEGVARGGRARRALSLILRLVVSLGIIALAAIPAFVLVDTLLPPPQSKFGLVNGRPVPSSLAVDDGLCPSNAGIVVYLYLDKLDVTNGLLDVKLSACVGQVTWPLLKRDPGAILKVSGVQSQSGFSGPLSAAVCFSCISNVVTAVGSVAVPADGIPSRYPLDSYKSSVDVGVDHESAALTYVNLSVLVRANPGVSDFSWSAGEPRIPAGNSTPFGCPAHCGTDQVASIEARRPVKTDLFVLCLVTVPLVLITLMAFRLSTTPPRSVEVLVGVIAIMLAILPIRTVLVPSDISSLTLVDYALAVEMAALAAGTALRYLWPPLTREARPASPGNPD